MSPHELNLFAIINFIEQRLWISASLIDKYEEILKRSESWFWVDFSLQIWIICESMDHSFSTPQAQFSTTMKPMFVKEFLITNLGWTETNSKVDWRDAMDYCHQRGMQVPMLKSSALRTRTYVIRRAGAVLCKNYRAVAYLALAL